MKIKLTALFLILNLVACGENKTKRDRINPVANSEQTIPDSPIPGDDNSDEANVGDQPDTELLPDEGDSLAPSSPVVEISDELKPVMEAAINGQRLVNVNLNGIYWNIEKVTAVPVGNEITITGRIVHRKPLNIGDYVDYEFKFVGGKLISNQIKVKERSWLPIASKVLDVVAKYSGLPIPVELVASIIMDLEKTIAGDWEMEANKLATMIAMQVYAGTATNP